MDCQAQKSRLQHFMLLVTCCISGQSQSEKPPFSAPESADLIAQMAEGLWFVKERVVLRCRRRPLQCWRAGLVHMNGRSGLKAFQLQLTFYSFYSFLWQDFCIFFSSKTILRKGKRNMHWWLLYFLINVHLSLECCWYLLSYMNSGI